MPPCGLGGVQGDYRYRETLYHIDVMQTPAGDGEMHVSVDGIEQHDKGIHLVDDLKNHGVEVRIPVKKAVEN